VSDAGESLFGRYRDEVRARLSLRDLVEECRPKQLRATGKSSLLCCSPLREDRHPSFAVFEGGGEYVAFDHATRESFDLFAFVQAREGLDFPGAVKWCGDRTNLPWDEYKRAHGGEGGGRPAKPDGFTDAEWDRAIEQVALLDEEQLVAEVQQAMVSLCHAFFTRTEKLVQYVTDRWGLAEETQRRFMLGYVPEGFAGLLEDLREEGVFPYDKRALVKTGWFLARNRIPDDPNPDLRCIFDGRLLYPYLLRGKCRYACARILFEDRIDRSYFEAHPWEQAKFKKALVGGPSHPSVSPYVQNDLLYNADNAYRSRTGFERLIIVEGPSDCMAVVEAGYDCVAPVATSIRTEDVPMLIDACSRYREVILATDTDVKPDGRRPGLEGALRMAPELLKAGKRVRLLVFPLPPGEVKVDPASWSLTWKRAGKKGDPFAALVADAPTVAGALVQFVDPTVAAAELPAALEPVARFAREAKASKAEIEELAALVRDRLRGKFTKGAVRAAMGEADDKVEAEARARDGVVEPVPEPETLQIEGVVLERGGHDQPGRARCYQGYGKDDTPTVVSTFILQPTRIIVSNNGDRLLECSVHIEIGTTLLERWTVPKKAWTSRREFVGSFPHERMQFNGSDHNVHAVYQIVSERAHRLGVPTVRGESVVGVHRTPRGLRLVLPHETWDADGPMENPDIVYSTETGSVPFCAMLKVDGAQRAADVDALVRRIVPLIFELNDPVKLATVCAWTVGCYFLPEIREMNGGKASILNVFGSPQSAKSTTIHRIINRTLQPYGPGFNPATPAETKFATIRNLSWSNTFVSAFDEYRVTEAGADFVRLLRTGFSGGVEGRGARDQTMRGYDLCGAVEVTGEQRADVDAAMGDRLVMVGLDKNRIDVKDTPPALRELEAAEDRWRVATDILQWRMRVDAPTVRRWWAESKTHALEALARMGVQVPPRTRDACAEVAFRLRAWHEWLDHRAERAMDAVPRPALDLVLRRMLETASGLTIPEEAASGVVLSLAGKSLVVRALEAVTPYAIQGTFEERKCYRLVLRKGRLMLVVYPGSLAVTLAKEARVRGVNDPTNGEIALRAAGKEEFEKSGEGGWLINWQFPYRMGSTDDVGEDDGKTKRMRCWLIDVELAHERVGLELDWPGTHATWGGNRRTTVAQLPTWRRVTTSIEEA
jgi:DNA primase